MGGDARRRWRRSQADVDALGELPLGGTAVGTGINAPPSFAPTVIAALAAETGLPLRPSTNPMVQQGGQGALADASSGLRASPRADEDRQRHPVAVERTVGRARRAAAARAAGGSSIMPGKVNPVLCESVNQVAARVFGNDATVAFAASQGILELNTYLPVMADALFESGTLLANVCRLFAERCVAGIEADVARCRGYAERSPAIATALNPIIGYAQAAELVHRAVDERRSIIDVVIEAGVLDEAAARRSSTRSAHRHRPLTVSRCRGRRGGARSPASVASSASRRPLAPKRNVAGVTQPCP